MTARWCCLPAPLPGGSLGFLLTCGGLPRTSAPQGRSGSCWILKAWPSITSAMFLVLQFRVKGTASFQDSWANGICRRKKVKPLLD